ncbi:polysaccharide biosynthesis/export family protein [Gluconacetobacter tumulisoli]|uniref:Polysaccharide export protein n=1 Tax=Gluconacetobacter tumulisoli TaxID=1286189 RepID=A0A7W4K696_9PROT|nr:polysaccharide biosynthesis/export family protein [Gluconacetobacter tumulisoli]MBB2201121.1 polysaccharide export protein [Gluconacetobacter tumulisoli]
MSARDRFGVRLGVALFAVAMQAGCSVLPNGGPMVSDVKSGAEEKTGFRFALVPVDQQVLNLVGTPSGNTKLAALHEDRPAFLTLGPGDLLQVAIYQVGPLGVFSQSQTLGMPQGGGSGPSAPGAPPSTFISGLAVDEGGYITFPYAGRVHVGGLTVTEAQNLLLSRLKEKLTDPQVIVAVISNVSNLATVMGAVKTPGRFPLTPASETILQVITAAGGPTSLPTDILVELTRHGRTVSVPMEDIVRIPANDIHVDRGDLINLVFKPRMYQVFGAARTISEYSLGERGSSVADGLAHGGGLLDAQADPRGVYLFRYEAPSILRTLDRPLPVAGTDQVPVVYAFDMSKPTGYFMAMKFQLRSGDLLFTSDARLVQWMKVFNLLGTLTQAGSRGATFGGGM